MWPETKMENRLIKWIVGMEWRVKCYPVCSRKHNRPLGRRDTTIRLFDICLANLLASYSETNKNIFSYTFHFIGNDIWNVCPFWLQITYWLNKCNWINCTVCENWIFIALYTIRWNVVITIHKQEDVEKKQKETQVQRSCVKPHFCSLIHTHAPKTSRWW